MFLLVLFPLYFAGLVPLYRYYNGKDHFYTSFWGELEIGKNGYKYEGIEGHVHNKSEVGTVPIHRYWNGVDHCLTTEYGELGNCTIGYVYEGIIGYLFPTQIHGTIPLYRYWNGVDHFYTTRFAELGNGKNTYHLETVIGYVYAATLFYNIAHMTNNIESVKWAIRNGANAVELDYFCSEFTHGIFCDCFCSMNLLDHVCEHYGVDGGFVEQCNAKETAENLLGYIASTNLALIIIDSKTTNEDEIYKSVLNFLFRKGYKGKVLISAASSADWRYLMKVASLFRKHKELVNRVFVSIDWDNVYSTTMESYKKMCTTNLAYGGLLTYLI